MIDTLVNLLFRCRHKRLSRPITLSRKAGAARQNAYVVCLDCGKHFAYDVERMRLGKALRRA